MVWWAIKDADHNRTSAHLTFKNGAINVKEVWYTAPFLNFSFSGIHRLICWFCSSEITASFLKLFLKMRNERAELCEKLALNPCVNKLFNPALFTRYFQLDRHIIRMICPENFPFVHELFQHLSLAGYSVRFQSKDILCSLRSVHPNLSFVTGPAYFHSKKGVAVWSQNTKQRNVGKSAQPLGKQRG